VTKRGVSKEFKQLQKKVFRRWKIKSVSTVFYSDKEGVTTVLQQLKKVVLTVKKRCLHSGFGVTKKVFQ